MPSLHHNYRICPELENSQLTNHYPLSQALRSGPGTPDLSGNSAGAWNHTVKGFTSLRPSAPPSPQLEQGVRWTPGASLQRDLARNRVGFPPPFGLLGGRAPPGPKIQGPSGAWSPRCTRFLQKGQDTPCRSAPRWGRAPSGTSRPPYLTRAASPGRHHGAAGPVRLLRRRHLPAPGPRPRRQPRPVPDGARAIARDFTLGPAHQASVAEGSAPKPRPLQEPTRPRYVTPAPFHRRMFVLV